MGATIAFWFLVEWTLAFVVFCGDSVGEESPRPPRQRFLRAVCWPITLGRWFTHRNLSKLARFGAIVWLLVTTGWLLSLENDRLKPTGLCLLAIEATMAFVVYCVDAMSADLHHRPVRRVLRSALWMKPLAGYLWDQDSIKIIQASVTVWVLLTTGWLLGLMHDRIAQPLGWLAGWLVR
jgi:hypothetical protein